MSSENPGTVSKSNATAAAVTTTATDTEVPKELTLEERAAQINKHLDAIAALLPEVPPLDGTTVKFVRRRQGVRDSMVAKAITTHETTPRLQSILNVEKARTMLSVQAIFRPIFDRMKAMVTGIKFILDSMRAEVGAEVRQFYQVAKTVAERTPDAAEVAEHVKNMAQDIRAGRKAKPKGVAATASDAKNKS